MFVQFDDVPDEHLPMSRRRIGWLWVAGQAVLLITLVLLPGRDDWATPGWLQLAASAFFFGGLAILAAAAFGLGTALTPTPVPRDTASLRTDGPYRFVRHPIYTGVIAVVAGIALRSGSLVQLALAVVTVAFFDRKAAWEEERLREHYAGYDEYAATTPKFFPRPF